MQTEAEKDKEIVNLERDEQELLNGLLENMNNGTIDPSLYIEYDVKRGLRDSNGKGVLTGLTEISDVVSYDIVGGRKIPCDGRLYYHNYNIVDLIAGFGDRLNGFEETTYLLLFGSLPNREQLDRFFHLISDNQTLSMNFTRDVIMKAPSSNIMNALQKSVLTLYSYDNNPEDISAENVLRQSIQLIAKMPLISVYAYCAYRHYKQHDSLMIRNPVNKYSTAENILYMLRENGEFTELEAKVLDVALVVHAEHGGGNNSTFTMHVVTSSGTDTYSAVAAALSSLKGPKHGGANLKVCGMFREMKQKIRDWDDEDEINAYLEKLLNKEAFDRSGLIYGMGHAVYSVSDPRAVAFKKYVERLAAEKQMEREYRFYSTVERLAAAMIAKKRRIYKGVSANIDFYSGFCYSMLGLPEELYTPLFATARIAGWSAHRIEELVNGKKIIRPAYLNVQPKRAYIPLGERGI